MSASFTNLVLAQIELWTNHGTRENEVYLLPKVVERVAEDPVFPNAHTRAAVPENSRGLLAAPQRMCDIRSSASARSPDDHLGAELPRLERLS